jgi:hypothetical protein
MRKAGLEECIAVGQADGDKIARPDAFGGKGAGAPVGAAFELLQPRPAASHRFEML